METNLDDWYPTTFGEVAVGQFYVDNPAHIKHPNVRLWNGDVTGKPFYNRAWYKTVMSRPVLATHKF